MAFKMKGSPYPSGLKQTVSLEAKDLGPIVEDVEPKLERARDRVDVEYDEIHGTWDTRKQYLEGLSRKERRQLLDDYKGDMFEVKGLSLIHI